ncbi:hypothetical protein QQF64_005289 [Cirrhinus molitorella]|uniref:Uncharacterized protein n=1 Tax=Cirrhinus molitorella TaxID=172907 RepID=A0ABR3MBS1_9TELE
MFVHPPGIIRGKGRKSQAVRKVFLRGVGWARSGRGQPEDRALRIIHFTINCIHHGRAKISRTRDHSQSQSGETVVDLWET